MTTTPTASRASRSGNPATKSAAAKATAAKKRADIEAEAAARAAQEERQRKAQEDFKNLVLPAPVLDEDGYEIIPDKSTLEGQSYKFKVAGKAYVLPNLQYLPVNLALGGKTEEEVHAAVFGRYAPDLLDYCSADQLTHIFKRWTEYSKGVGLGE
jgi:hypothetical protein